MGSSINVAHRRACPGGSVTGSYNAAATIAPGRRIRRGADVVACRMQATEPSLRSRPTAAPEGRPAAGGGRATGLGSYQSSPHWDVPSGGGMGFREGGVNCLTFCSPIYVEPYSTRNGAPLT